MTFMGNYLNPPITVWKGQCVSLSTHAPAVQPIRSMMTIIPLDKTCSKVDFNFTFNDSILLPDTNPMNFLQTKSGSFVTAEDPRILVLPNDDLHAVFTSHYVTRHRIPQIGYSMISVNSSSSKLLYSDKYIMNSDNKEGQKNWTPFLYNNTVHYVAHLNPLQVITANEEEKQQQGNKNVYMKTVSQSSHVNITWSSGHLRGGTPAHLINKDEYLSIFHSSRVIPSSMGTQGRITFFMGGITFSSHPPFKVIRISSAPFIHEKFYNGPWFKRRYDYIVYPMGYVFCHSNGTKTTLANEMYELIELKHMNESSNAYDNVDIILSFGMQDVEGWTARINVDELLDTMEFVSY